MCGFALCAWRAPAPAPLVAAGRSLHAHSASLPVLYLSLVGAAPLRMQAEELRAWGVGEAGWVGGRRAQPRAAQASPGACTHPSPARKPQQP